MEMEKEASVSNALSHTSDGENYAYSACFSVEKKLRLFGFELNPCSNSSYQTCLKAPAEGDESVNSSNTVTYATDKATKDNKSSPGEAPEDRKFECQYCFKEFANSQALGGHQNAHKKERRKKKRLQLQARKASINRYLQPIQNNINFGYHGSNAWFYDPSCYTPDQFTLYEESQISFNSHDQECAHHPNGSQVPKWYTLPTQTPFQQESCMFTITRTDRFGEINRPGIVNPSPLPSKQSCKSLDLQLGLSLQSGI